jgi:integrase
MAESESAGRRLPPMDTATDLTEDLVPASTRHALETVRGLPKGRGGVRQTKPQKPADWEQLSAVPPHDSRTIAAMLQLQWRSGMRRYDVRFMLTCDIDQTNPSCWSYRPMKHKNDWRDNDRERVVPLGPQCIEVLRPWLRPDDPEAFLFHPRQAEADHNTRRRAQRGTPLTPSQRYRPRK